MLGAIAGDIFGAPFEKREILAYKDNGVISIQERKKVLDTNYNLFDEELRFTDDTVMTVAVADTILENCNYVRKLKEYGRKYIEAGYGKRFKEWLLKNDLTPNDSFGNGSAMRVSPIGFAFNTIEEVLQEAKKSAEASHKHIEAVKGAQAVASCIFFARKCYDKEYIKKYVAKTFGYDLNKTLDQIRQSYTFDETCQGSVPQAIIAFLESNDFEDTIRKAISIGGDSDTIACMAGGIAQAYYKEIPQYIVDKALKCLDDNLKSVLNIFRNRFNC